MGPSLDQIQEQRSSLSPVYICALVVSVQVLKGDLNHPNHELIFQPFKSLEEDIKPLVADVVARRFVSPCGAFRCHQTQACLQFAWLL
jgi:hypothetical protein